jgi:hypothetical protein
MSTEAKMVRWSNLDGPAKAKQFTERGTERTARAVLRASCIFCNKSINEGSDYYDVNGAKFAHKLCVLSHSSNLSKHSKVITHKMFDELSAKKAAQLSVVKTGKRGRPPKSAKLVEENEEQSTTASAAPRRGRPPKAQSLKKAARAARVASKAKSGSATGAKRGPKPKIQAPNTTPTINLTEVREALPGAIVTLTITGTVEAVQRALDKLQN